MTEESKLENNEFYNSEPVVQTSVFKDGDIIQHVINVVSGLHRQCRQSNFEPVSVSYETLELILKVIVTTKTRTKSLEDIVANIRNRKEVSLKLIEKLSYVVTNDGIDVK